MAQFCTKCGTPQTEGMRFCPACGAASDGPAAQAPAAQALVAPVAPPSAVGVAPRPAPAAPVAAPTASSGSSFLKTVLGCLGVLFILGLLIAGAGAYFYYYHIKPKVTQIENTVRSFPLPTGTPQEPAQPASPGRGASSPGGPGGVSSSAPQSPAPPVDIGQALEKLGIKVPANSPLAKLGAMMNRPEPHFPALTSGDPSVYTGTLVLQPGMTIAESVSEPLLGDHDVLISITSVSEKSVTSNLSAQLPANNLGATSPANAAVVTSHMLHTDSQQDLMHATNILTIFSDKYPQLVPGATMFLYSQDAFRAMKSGSGVDLTVSVLPTASSLRVAPNDFWSTLVKVTCHEARVEAADAAFPVLLNGQRVTLPAIRMSCPNNGTSGTEYVLDDDKMPLTLAANGQITQINYPPTPSSKPAGGGTDVGGGQSIEQALKKEGRVDVYGIYFDFASDKLRPESTPVLEEIASTLKNNPTWKLHVNGHTDNIGGDAYNLDLSNRRAAAVKQALVTQYHIDSARLDPEGFGATQPKESNDTMQGRARNRRVELIRE